MIKKYFKNLLKGQDNKNIGLIASLVGGLCNIFLFLLKFLIGVILNSVSITADSFNNLSDAISNIISFFSFKISNKPPDEDHPFGHGRIEYIATLAVSFIILLIGYEFLKNSVLKIFNKEVINFNAISIVILLFTICIKTWLGFFYKNLSKKINSIILLANSKDSFNDVIITSATVFSLFFTKFTNIVIDGYIGIIVSFVILKNGIDLFVSTLDQILGKKVSTELANKIRNIVESYEDILGTHDLIVHDYGNNVNIATIHAEVTSKMNLKDAHNIIDNIERQVYNSLNVALLIHIDPVILDNKVLDQIKDVVYQYINTCEHKFKAYDFRIVSSDKFLNIIFDLSVPYNCTNDDVKNTIDNLKQNIILLDNSYNCIINLKRSFVN